MKKILMMAAMACMERPFWLLTLYAASDPSGGACGVKFVRWLAPGGFYERSKLQT